MDEQKVNQTLNNATAAAGAGSTTPAASTSTSASETTVKPKFAYEDPELTAHINSMYDAYGNARRTALQEAGDQALSDAQANRDKIAQQYQTQRNMASVDWERQRRNFMESANMNGLNTGAGGQAQLAMQGRYQQTQNQLGYQQANAEAEADRQMTDIKRQTQAKINEAIADNDYKRAASLLDQYNVMYQRALQEAQARAQYGDFGGYGTLYGNDTATQMSNMWYAQNPDLAYQMGLINKNQYDNLKARKPINEGLDEFGNRIVKASGGYYYGNDSNGWAYVNTGGNDKFTYGDQELTIPEINKLIAESQKNGTYNYDAGKNLQIDAVTGADAPISAYGGKQVGPYENGGPYAGRELVNLINSGLIKLGLPALPTANKGGSSGSSGEWAGNQRYLGASTASNVAMNNNAVASVNAGHVVSPGRLK